MSVSDARCDLSATCAAARGVVGTILREGASSRAGFPNCSVRRLRCTVVRPQCVSASEKYACWAISRLRASVSLEVDLRNLQSDVLSYVVSVVGLWPWLRRVALHEPVAALDREFLYEAGVHWQVVVRAEPIIYRAVVRPAQLIRH